MPTTRSPFPPPPARAHLEAYLRARQPRAGALAACVTNLGLLRTERPGLRFRHFVGPKEACIGRSHTERIDERYQKEYTFPAIFQRVSLVWNAGHWSGNCTANPQNIEWTIDKEFDVPTDFVRDVQTCAQRRVRWVYTHLAWWWHGPSDNPKAGLFLRAKMES